MPKPSNPQIEAARFALAEAEAAGATVLLLMWESPEGARIETFPRSGALIRGFSLVLSDLAFPEPDDGADEDD